MEDWVSITSPTKYAIVKPTMAGFGLVIAKCITVPLVAEGYHVVILRGLYRNEVGQDMPYCKNSHGLYEEADVGSTVGT